MGTRPTPRTTVLAGDLGGTKCRFGLLDADDRVVAVEQVATVRDRAAFLAATEAALGRMRAACPPDLSPPSAVGLGLAGVIAPDQATVATAPNLPLDGFPLAAHLQARLGLPGVLLNDGRASALGEFHRGKAKGRDPLLCLFFGTGVGIGLVVDGRPFAGADNAAGEIGHLIHVPGGRRCACGGLGHYEAYCGGRAMVERATAELGPRADGRPWTAGLCAAHDSAAARAICADAAAAAMALVANAVTLLNPRAVVLGGGLLDGWPELRARLVASVQAECRPLVTRHLLLTDSLGGSDAVLWGAAAAARALSSRPAS